MVRRKRAAIFRVNNEWRYPTTLDRQAQPLQEASKTAGFAGKFAEKEPNSAKKPSRRNSDSDSNSDEEVVTKKKKNPGHHVDSDEE